MARRTLPAALAAVCLLATATTAATAAHAEGPRPAGHHRHRPHGAQTLWTSDARLTDDGRSTIVGLDPATGEETARIPVGTEAEPWSIAVTRDGSTAYVGNHRSGTLAVVDTAARKTTDEIPLGVDATYVRLSHDEKKLYVTGAHTESLTIVDTATKTVDRTVTLPAPAEGAALSPDDTTVYVGVYAKNEVLALDAATGKQTAAYTGGKDFARRVEVSPDGRKLYATDYYGGKLDVYDTAEPSAAPKAVPVGGQPYDLVLSPNGRTLYASGTDGGVTAVDTRDLHASTLTVSPSFGDLALARDGRTLYLAENRDDGRIDALDTRSGRVTRTFATDLADPNGLALGPHA